MSIVRTRFAPSPTGALHAGTLRTALFAWLATRHSDGHFILRIEDTDTARTVEGAIDNIKESLDYIGLNWDEGPDKPSDVGPFFQSQRLDIYKEWANKLIDSGRAYADPYSQSELEELRNQAKNNHQPFLFRDHRPEDPPAWDGNQPLRFKSEPKKYTWYDLVMGEMSSSEEAIDDFIIIKSDGFPTYNFAHIIDDYLMKITHIIRSQEFISSVPKYLNLYEALGIDAPNMATLPQVLNENGNKKLSKRDGAKQIIEYKNIGILPDAMTNYLAMLGWNDGTTQEIFSREELIQKFDLSRVQKGGAHFSEQHLFFINGVYIRNTSLDKLYEMSKNYWPDSASIFPDEYKKKALGLIQERLKYLAEIPDLSVFFFEDLPQNPSLIESSNQLKTIPHDQLKEWLKLTKGKLELSDFTKDDLQIKLNELLNETNQKPAALFSLIRIATTQAPASPGLAETLEVLGKEVTFRRINNQIENL